MSDARAEALRRGVRLEVLTIAWMAAEAALAIGAGIAARSVLLTAFGADSVIELLSGVVLYRRLASESEDDVERLEASAIRISAILLAFLCGYVLLSTVAGVVLRVEPTPSGLGIAVSAAALIAMPLLARAKRRVNRVLDSPSLRADIAETVSCAYLAAVTLGGVAVAALTGWWWIQYVAAFALLAWLIPEAREALEAWRHNGLNHGGKGIDRHD
ncbi:MAG TPA: cation transporter [Candidatus Limnocylindrales bacterium]|nr:cation transporter [Candidatus Limnocylindrales bacterium]